MIAHTNSSSLPTAALYAEHCSEKNIRFQTILEATGYDRIVIGSGAAKLQFQDDMAYPFKANPYFKEWVPLDKRADCFLIVSGAQAKPVLCLKAVEDIWHSSPQSLPANFAQCLEIIEYQNLQQLKKQLLGVGDKVVLINETNDLELPAHSFNPPAVLNQIDFQRRLKTQYEQSSVRHANLMAVPAHRAAEVAFRDGGSELEVAAAYLAACNCSETEMPYSIIAGINEHAAVLHHHQLDNQKVSPRSLLIDAGVTCYGYASDITRTYAFDQGSNFAAMIEQMDGLQQELVALGGIGQCPVELHVHSQHKIAQLMINFNLLNYSAEQAVEEGVINTFYPHGLGHHLGCNVHDKGSQLANPQGDPIPASKTYPNLRASAPMEANQIHTVEPGVYFIPALLDRLRASDLADSVNWSEITDWIPFGGIRIEDNIILHSDNRLENVTRAAFASLQPPQ